MSASIPRIPQRGEPELVFRDAERGLTRYFVIADGMTIDIDLQWIGIGPNQAMNQA